LALYKHWTKSSEQIAIIAVLTIPLTIAIIMVIMKMAKSME
jgi:hypothetical protein